MGVCSLWGLPACCPSLRAQVESWAGPCASPGAGGRGCNGNSVGRAVPVLSDLGVWGWGLQPCGEGVMWRICCCGEGL